MKSKSQHIDTLFDTITKTRRTIRRVLNEANEMVAQPEMNVTKNVQDEKFEDPNQSYEGKSGVVLNLKKVTKATNREKELILNDLGKVLVTEGTKMSTEMELAVRDIHADLTKIKQELTQINTDFAENKIKTIEDVRQKFKYFVTRYNNSKDKIREYEAKRVEWQTKINWERYEQKLAELETEYQTAMDNLKNEFNVSNLDEIDAQISELHQEASNNVAEIEKNAKDSIREIRSIITEMYEAPKEIFDASQIIIKAMGAVASISPMVARYNMKPEGFRKILANPELMEALGEFIDEVEYSDKVTISNAKVKELGLYFSELKLKSANKIKSFEDAEKTLNEGVFGNIASKAVAESLKVFGDIIKHIAQVTKLTKKRVTSTLNSVTKMTTEMKNDGKKLSKSASRAFLSVKKEIQTAQADYYSELQGKIK